MMDNDEWSLKMNDSQDDNEFLTDANDTNEFLLCTAPRYFVTEEGLETKVW